MRLIEAIIKPFQLEEVKTRLNQVGIRGITLEEVRGFGRQKGRTSTYRGTEIHNDLIPKIKIQIATPDSMADAIVAEIQRSARTGEIGDGKIFVHPLEQVIRIRTGETGDAAI
jgi:nitrogen regulatory protein PII